MGAASQSRQHCSLLCTLGTQDRSLRSAKNDSGKLTNNSNIWTTVEILILCLRNAVQCWTGFSANSPTCSSVISTAGRFLIFSLSAGGGPVFSNWFSNWWGKSLGLSIHIIYWLKGLLKGLFKEFCTVLTILHCVDFTVDYYFTLLFDLFILIY